MEYISNNKELNEAIKLAYLHKIEPYELADVYFDNKLYSAAVTYYTAQLDLLHINNDNNNDCKSYCFGRIAECYFNQQKDHQFSNWQLSMIYDMCKESIIYDNLNYKSYLICGKALIALNRYKDAYFIYYQFITDLNKYVLKEEDLTLVLEVIYEFFDLCEMFHIIKYDNIYKEIINKLTQYDYVSYNTINEVHCRYKKHKEKISQIELDIMNHDISNYY